MCVAGKGAKFASGAVMCRVTATLSFHLLKLSASKTTFDGEYDMQLEP